MTATVHFWRFYFRYTNADPSRFTESSRLNWMACDRAVKRFSDVEISVLEKYYVTEYGGYEDLKVIKEFAEKNGIDPAWAWDMIKRANYEAAVERGLIDRKEVINSAVLQCDSSRV